MRTLAVVITALAAWLVSAPPGAAQTVVTVRGTIRSLDSARANMVLRSSGQDRLVILPVDVSVRLQGDTGRALSVNDLAEGGVAEVDATRGRDGVLTARRVVLVPGPDGEIVASGPSPANKVSVRPSRGGRAGVVVSSDTEGAGRFVAARASLLNQPVGELHVNGRTVFRFRGNRGEDPFVRATVVANRLNSPGMAELRPDEVHAGRVGGEWVVLARGVVLITADTVTARINRTTPQRLAEQWAANMRARLR